MSRDHVGTCVISKPEEPVEHARFYEVIYVAAVA